MFRIIVVRRGVDKGALKEDTIDHEGQSVTASKVCEAAVDASIGAPIRFQHVHSDIAPRIVNNLGEKARHHRSHGELPAQNVEIPPRLNALCTLFLVGSWKIPE